MALKRCTIPQRAFRQAGMPSLLIVTGPARTTKLKMPQLESAVLPKVFQHYFDEIC